MKKAIFLILTLILTMSLQCIPVSAAGNWGSMRVSANVAEVSQGQEITLTVYLGDCTALEGGVKNYKATVTVPEGLTVNSAAVESGFDAATGMISSTASVKGNVVTISSLGNVTGSYTGGEIAVATIVCSADEVGTYNIGFTASLTDNNYATQTPAYSGTTVTVTEPVHEHVWDNGTITTPAGCEHSGVKTYTCTVSGCTETKTETIPATGHAWGEWKVTTAPTCTEKGVETRVCANDASHTETREVSAKGHAWSEWKVTTAPTCTEKGVETRVCANDASHTETREVSAKGHAWSEWKVTTAPTCTEKGVETRECVCGEKETREISVKDHAMNSYGKDATHHWLLCDNCDYVGEKETHDYDYNGVCVCGETKPVEDDPNLDDVPETGDITPYIAMTFVSVMALAAAVAFVLKRKAVK